jgi:hypothetical protein
MDARAVCKSLAEQHLDWMFQLGLCIARTAKDIARADTNRGISARVEHMDALLQVMHVHLNAIKSLVPDSDLIDIASGYFDDAQEWAREIREYWRFHNGRNSADANC